MFRYLRQIVLTLVATAVAIGASPLMTAAQEATPAPECVQTTAEENEALAMAYWAEAVWGEQGLIDEIVAPDEVHHWGIAGDTAGFEEFAERWSLFNDAFPDLKFTVDLVAAEGDLAATLWTATGTQRGEWQGIAPTDREVSWTGMNLFRFDCGLIVESWGEADHLGLRAQLGAADVPAMLASPVMDAGAPGEAPAATPCSEDSPEANLETALRWTDEVWTGQNLDVVDEIFEGSAVHHGAAFPDASGAEAIKGALQRQFEAFPGMTLTADMTIADGDLVAVRWTGSGTHEGSWLGLEPSGREVSLTGINMYRLNCGKIVESWSEMNVLQVLQALTDDAAATPAA